MNNQKCLKTRKHKYLWFTWESKYYEHAWAYLDKETRVCSNCGLRQLYFGEKKVYNSVGGYYHELS